MRGGKLDPYWQKISPRDAAIGPAQLTLNKGNSLVATMLRKYGFTDDEIREANTEGVTSPELKAKIDARVDADPGPMLEASNAQMRKIRNRIADHFQENQAQGVWAGEGDAAERTASVAVLGAALNQLNPEKANAQKLLDAVNQPGANFDTVVQAIRGLRRTKLPRSWNGEKYESVLTTALSGIASDDATIRSYLRRAGFR